MLEQAVRADYTPDLIIGIARGGAIVARMMFAGCPHIEVRAMRSSTTTKLRLRPLAEMLRHLPRCVANGLRIAEARWLSSKKPDILPVSLDPGIVESLKGARCALLVDDAVDSGNTLHRVAQAIEHHAPTLCLRIAALTVTRPRPLATPNYFIYKDGTLLRFPWSFDYKE